MEKFFKNKKTPVILSALTSIFGVIALILLLRGGVEFSNPVVWVMIILIVFSLLELFTVENKK